MNSLTKELPRLLDGLSAIVVGTRNAELVPACILAVGIAADEEGHATVFIPEATGGAVFDNVEANGQIAVVLEHIPTHRTLQLKGTSIEVRPAREDERGVVEKSQAAFFQDVGVIGAPAHVLSAGAGRAARSRSR